MNIFQTLYARLLAKSPLFFKVIKWVGFLVAFVTGLPASLEQYHIVLPAAWVAVENKGVAIAAIVGSIIASLTVDTPVQTDAKLNDVIK